MGKQVDYRIYPSLLDKFVKLINSDEDADSFFNLDAEGEYKHSADEIYEKNEIELINSINRCPKEPIELADRGTAFNEVCDMFIESRQSRIIQTESLKTDAGENILSVKYNGWQWYFGTDMIDEVLYLLKGGLPQFITRAKIGTAKGSVELYGYIDYVMPNRIIDLKTCNSYEFGKYQHGMQRYVYPYCMIENKGMMQVDSFIFLAVKLRSRLTEVSGSKIPVLYGEIYPEEYTYNHEQAKHAIKEVCERFIEWLEYRREYITDEKIFGGENPADYVGVPITELSNDTD